MKRHRRTIVGLIAVLIAACAFLIAPVFARDQQAQADQSEIGSLYNQSHTTVWAYYTDPTGKWFISDYLGTTYALGRNSRGHVAWIAIANQGAVATIDFNNKKVSLRADTATRTPNDSYLAISLVYGEVQETVRGGTAREFANLINGNTLDLKWYFFQVPSTGQWYIVQITGANSAIYRLKLNASQNQYDWQSPRDASGIGVDTSNWVKSFFQEHGFWKVRFGPLPPTTGFGSVVGSFNGVAAYSNRPYPTGARDSNLIGAIRTGLKWECVEYVNRYYYLYYGMSINPNPSAAQDFYAHEWNGTLVRHANATSTTPPPTWRHFSFQ